MAILEFLKKNAQALIAGNAGAGQSSEYVTADVLAQILYEMYGSSQSGIPLPAGFLGSFFPGGETLTGTNMIARTVDAVSVSSAAASPTNLKSFVVPAANPQILGLGTAAVPGVRGLWFYASGTCGAAANTKQITVGFGGSAQQAIVNIAASVVSPWSCFGTVLVRSNTSVVLNGYGATCVQTTGASFQSGGVNLAVTALTLTAAQTLQFQGVSAAAGAGDTVQDTLIVGYIP
jgi:hypothetical protein